MLYSDYSLHNTSCMPWWACLGKRNEFSRAGVCCVCPSPQSSLATGPRFVRLSNTTAWGGYLTRQEGIVCVVPKQQGLVSNCKPCSPGRKVAHRSRWSHAWGVWKGETHHGGKCIDGRMYQAGVFRIPPTNVPSPNENVYVDQTSYMSGQSWWKTNTPASSPKSPNGGLQVVTLCTWESLTTPIKLWWMYDHWWLGDEHSSCQQA